jgi:hypothetical protein
MTERPEGNGGRPHTDGLPKTQPLRPSQVRQNAYAKRMLMRLVQGDSPPTAPMNIVDRLAGSPYANPTIQVVGVDACTWPRQCSVTGPVRLRSKRA